MFFLKELPTQEMIQGYSDYIEESGEAQVESALVMMRDASVLVRRIDHYFSAAKLSQLKFLIMIVIDREVDRNWLYQSEIADKLDVSKPVLTRTIQSFEKAGLICVEVEERDKRWKRLSLSSEGANLLSELLPDYYKLIVEFMRAKDASR